MSPATLQRRIEALGPWFHDLDLDGVRTAPDHPLGGFLRDMWRQVQPAFPKDMSGKTVLDIGCNAGFYSLQLHARGAAVLGIDHNPRYLEQARLAAQVLGAEIEYHQMEAYDVGELGRRFDYVLFMGVLYHLRYPLLALDRVAAAVRERLIFQSMLRGAEEVLNPEEDYPITEHTVFHHRGFPAMYFVENRYAGDPTNWWIPQSRGHGGHAPLGGVPDRRTE